MSAEAQVAKLESLLGRISDNRTDDPVRYPDAASRIEAKPAAPAPALELDDEIPEIDDDAKTIPPAAMPRRLEPTPMEKAISGELALDDDEPEISVSYPDEDEPELLIEEPEDAPAVELDAPTAPVGTRAPAASASPTTLEVAEPRPSAPVAKVVSRDAPSTFGELLDRALALRPR